jgi:hypothetical protein
MGPYIERTRDTMQSVYEAIESSGLSEKVSFGLVGYRGDTQAAPGLEYHSKVFVDLDEGVSGETFLANIANLRPASVSSAGGFSEDAYAGVSQAISDMDWSAYDARYVILITDAGPKAGGDPLASTGLSTSAMRDLTLENQISTWVLHLRTPEGATNHAYAEEQYRALSEIEDFGIFFYGVETGNVDYFQRVLAAVTSQLTEQVAETARGAPPRLSTNQVVA